MNNILAGDVSEDHFSACSWNCFAIIHTQELIRLGLLPKELDDLPKPPPPPITIEIPMEITSVTFNGKELKEQQ